MGWEPGALAGWDKEAVFDWIGDLIDAGLKPKSIPLAFVICEILATRQPDTVRGVMYAVVSKGWLPDTGSSSYNKAQRLLNQLRKKQVIPHQWITDNLRNTMKRSSWSGLEDYAKTVERCYRLDYWSRLPDYVCVIVEKDTVAGRIYPVTDKYDVALHPLRGYSSTTFSIEIAEQLGEIIKPKHVYYIGDHDPSGRDIERSIRENIEEYGGISFSLGYNSWRRLAVNPEDFDEYDIIPLEPKRTDRRYQQFAETYGGRCAEVEAIPADVLRDRVEAAIRSHIPQGQWQKLREIEGAEQQQWQEFMQKIGGAS